MNKRSLVSIAAGLVIALGFHCTATVYSAEKKAMKDVNVDALTSESQKMIGSGQGAFNLVWVIPVEFWQASLAQDNTVPEFQQRAILNVLKKYIIVGVVRADVSPLGSFRFHDEGTVFDGLHVAYVSRDKKRLPLRLQRRVDDDAQLVIDSIKPVLRAAMGKMGDNFHLFVCDSTAGPKRTRISPYDSGAVSVTLDRAGKNAGGTADIALPLDSLHVPRKCSKCGKPAHISWNFCPWCGTEHDK